MSFFSDLFEGNWNQLSGDLTSPSAIQEYEIGGAVLGTALLGGAALGGLGFLGADAAGAAAGAGAAADAGAIAGDVGAATAAGDIAASVEAAAPDALAFAPTTDALAVPADAFAGADVSGGTGFATDAAGAGGSTVAPNYSWTAADIQGPGIGTNVTADPNVAAYADNPSYQAPSFTKTLSDTLSSPYTKLALAGAPLVEALAFGQPKLPSQLGAAQANAQALASQGSSLNPSQTATLQQMRQNAINAARQALFNQGVQNPDADTRYAQMTANIDSQVTAAAQTMIQQNIQNSLAGDAQLIQIAQLQMQSDQNFANMLVNATKALGSVAGLSSGITLKAA